MSKILFSIPGMYYSRSLTLFLFKLINDFPEKFNDDCEIDSVYGSFPTIFNGGRSLKGEFSSRDVAETVRVFNSLGIRVRYTFTNLNLENSDIKDRVGNSILRTTVNNQTMKNDINLASNAMKRLINEKYSNKFNIVYSTTMCVKDVETINKLSKDNILVPDYSVNNNFELLKQLEHPENIELLANETCFANCPKRKAHYEWWSRKNLREDVENFECFFSKYNDQNYYRTNRIREHYISIDDIREKYLPLGFNKFKLIGRNESIMKVIEGLVDYLVKPEFKDEIRYDLITFVLDKMTGALMVAN